MAKVKNNLVQQDTMTPGITSLKNILSTEAVKKQIKAILKENASYFMMSLIQLVEGNPKLLECDGHSIINAGLTSALLKLPLDKNLGFSYIVPFRDKNKGQIAQFQLGYKGYIQLALRTGQYKYINTLEIKEGELKSINYLTGELDIEFIEDFNLRESTKTIGYASYIELSNGFKNTLFMSVEKIKEHARKYSQSYSYDISKGTDYSNWVKNFNAMALKTVLKLNLKKFGIINTDLQKAMLTDGATIINVENDNIKSEFCETDLTELEIVEKEKIDSLMKEAQLINFDLLSEAKKIGIDITKEITDKDYAILENLIIEKKNKP